MRRGRDKEASEATEQRRQVNLGVNVNEGPLIMELAAGDWIPGRRGEKAKNDTTEGTKTRNG